MINFFKRHPLAFAAIVVVLLAAIIAGTIGDKNVSTGENIVGSIYTPPASFTTKAINSVKGFFQDLFNRTDEHIENAQLKEKIKQLEGDNALLREFQLENTRLKEIANYTSVNSNYDIITAPIAAKNPGYWFDSFIISAGRNQGIQADMPVITTQGLVGRVMEVGGNWSKVLSIVDARSSVSGIVERTRDTGIIKGVVQSGSDVVCSMSYLPYDSDLIPGDKILSSGLGGVFPKGLVIGNVTEVSRIAEGGERTATISPSVNFNNLEEVMVIKNVFEQVSP